MAGKGGYQPPARPAPVSGPGALSKRTDGGPGQAPKGQPAQQLPDPGYGEQAGFQAAQQAAPMAQAAAPPTGPSPDAAMMPADLSRVTPLSAGTQRPDEPVTSGADSGPGPGAASVSPQDPATLARYRNQLQTMELLASMPGSSPTLRQYVRALRAVV